MAPKKGTIPWNKGMKGKQSWHNITGLIRAKKGNTLGFQKGVIPKTAFKKGNRPWNYIDGRSKLRGPDRYGEDWNKIRMQVYKRDKFVCQGCGSLMRNFKEAFHVHHIVPFLISRDNSIKNLITLCKSCHSKEEMRLRKAALRWATNNAKTAAEETGKSMTEEEMAKSMEEEQAKA